MDVVGCRGAGEHKNSASIDKNGLVGLGFRCMYDREIYRKYIHARSDIKGGNEVLMRVGMGSDGWRGMDGHAANTKQGGKVIEG